MSTYTQKEIKAEIKRREDERKAQDLLKLREFSETKLRQMLKESKNEI